MLMKAYASVTGDNGAATVDGYACVDERRMFFVPAKDMDIGDSDMVFTIKLTPMINAKEVRDYAI